MEGYAKSNRRLRSNLPYLGESSRLTPIAVGFVSAGEGGMLRALPLFPSTPFGRFVLFSILMVAGRGLLSAVPYSGPEEATIAQIQEAYLAGHLTARELTAAYLARIDAYDQKGPILNSIISINAHALEEADKLDVALKASGKLVGSLHGIPVVVKDNIDSGGDLPTSGGVWGMRNFQPTRDATVIKKLRDAGAIILAKASLAELANGGFDSINSRLQGYVRNPYNTAYASGGSSGGTGVAIAANFAVVGLGTDTGISVRAPASINSVVGLRVSHGLVSLDGVMPLNVKWDTVGPMGRTVYDVATLLGVIAGADELDPTTKKNAGHVPPSYTAGLKPDSLVGKRIGVLRQIFPPSDSDPRVVALLDRAIADLKAAGAVIVDPLSIPEVPALLKGWTGYTRMRDDLNGYFAKHPNAPYKTFKELIDSKQYLVTRFEKAYTDQQNYKYPASNDPDALKKDEISEQVRQAFLTVFDSAKLDGIVFPQFNFPPKRNGDTFTPLGRDQNTYSSITGFPALVVPIGFVDPGLPIGMQIFGRPWSEATLFQIGYGYEQATHHRHSPPSAPPLKESLAGKFIGTWKLVGLSEKDVVTGAITVSPRWPSAGQIVYAANGRLSVQIMKLDRPKVASGALNTATPDELKGTVDGFSSYFGTWELVPAEGYVVHAQEGSLLTNGIGQRAKRYYSFDAQGRLSLTVPPRKDGAREVSSILTWERIP